MSSIDFVGHIIESGKKKIINFPAGKFEELEKLIKKLNISDVKNLYFKIHLEPIIFEWPNKT